MLTLNQVPLHTDKKPNYGRLNILFSLVSDKEREGFRYRMSKLGLIDIWRKEFSAA